MMHPSAIGEVPDNHTPGELLVIETDKSTANNIVQLIHSANNVINAHTNFKMRSPTAFQIPEDSLERAALFKNVFQTTGFFERFFYDYHLPVAIALANAAWPDRSLIYAIHKLSRSYDEECVTPWSIHPRHGQIFDKHTGLFADHVTTCSAINLAFSAIEELQLQINSNRNNRRFIESESGKWNPSVLKDIQDRLKNAGIDPDENLDWIARGDESEPAIRPSLGIPSEYHDGQHVRDLELSIPDAIHYCSYVRNFMTAHGFSDNSTLLGPYEVYNVQHVARCLILWKSKLMNVGTDQLHDFF